MFKHWRVYIAVTNHLSFSLFSQIWPCSWTKESLSTMVPAGEHSSSTPVFSSFRSVPSLPLHSSLKLINYSLSHLISDCQKRPQLLSFPKTNECFREGSSSSLGSHLSPLSSPCLAFNTVPEGRDFPANAGNLICGEIEAFADSHHY